MSTIWVCGACGKTALSRYGKGNDAWDMSCMLHAVLCRDDESLKRGADGRVTHAEPVEICEARSDREVKP